MGEKTKAVTPPLHQAHPSLQGSVKYSQCRHDFSGLLKPRLGFLRWATSTTCRCIQQDVQPCPDITNHQGPNESEAPPVAVAVAVAIARPVSRLPKCHMAIWGLLT